MLDKGERRLQVVPLERSIPHSFRQEMQSRRIDSPGYLDVIGLWVPGKDHILPKLHGARAPLYFNMSSNILLVGRSSSTSRNVFK